MNKEQFRQRCAIQARQRIEELEALLDNAKLAQEISKEWERKYFETKKQLDAVRGLRRYAVIIEASDTYRLHSVDETGWNVGTVVLNTELQAALNGEGK